MNQWMEKRDRHLCTASRGPLVKGLQSVGCIAVLAILSACGGGGGGGGSSTSTSSADSLAQICTKGSPYVIDASRQTTVGTFSDEQKWVNAYLNERYLWYKDMPTNVQASAADYNLYTPTGYFRYGESLTNYFSDLLNQKTTSSGKYVDVFSFLTSTAAWNQYANSVELGYGFNVTGSVGSSSGVIISYVYPGSSGDSAGFKRGDRIMSIDGYSAASTNVDVGTAFNNALYPSSTAATTSHTFALSRSGTSLSITATPKTETLKQVEYKVLTNGNQKVGYLLFNSHVLSAEPDLIAAATSFKNQNVNDVIIDMRYNSGGYLSIASALSYSVAGASKTAGKTFDALTYNDKRTKENIAIPFYSTSYSGIAMPSLNMTRAYVLASANTCSASEAVVNGLRGVGVDVQLIGDTTCGKPYGFVAQDNCGVTYAAMEFVGFNAKNEQVNPDGMVPNCKASDDLTHALGDSSETMLSIALRMQQGSSCAQAQQASSALGSNAQRGFGTLLGGKLNRPAWKSNMFADDRTR